MRRMYIAIAGGIVVLGVGWYLFRPELLFIDKSVNEALPVANTGGSMIQLAGAFTGHAHETKGVAEVHALEGGERLLRLRDFETSNGPDVRVLLVAATSATDDAAVKDAGYIELGSLKGNIGDQNYDIPANVDLAKHRSVVIWCNRFSVNFGSASLTSSRAASASAAPMRVRAGMFHSVAHETKGTAEIFRLANGSRVLRLSDFETSNGPDVRVLLIGSSDATDNDAVKANGFVELGSLKGNIGDQNYEIPADVDLSKYRAVTIWCNRFGVNFGTAPLPS